MNTALREAVLSNAIPGDAVQRLQDLVAFLNRIQELQENALKIPGHGVEDINLRRSMFESVLGMLEEAERKIRSIAATFSEAKILLPLLFEWRRKVQEADLANLTGDIHALNTIAGQLGARLVDFYKPVASGAEKAAEQSIDDARALRDFLKDPSRHPLGRSLMSALKWGALGVALILLLVLLVWLARR